MKITQRLLIALALTSSAAFAQDSNNPGNDEEEVFTLSPFLVDGSKDSGYLASQTLAGTRLATDLKDAPSPVTILTQEFLEDIDATDINEALAFVPAVDEDPREYNSLNNNPVSTRIRGFQQTATNVNFFPTRTVTDRYNIDRIEINRGPNAILFGIGNPGGTYVATTKNAELGRNFGWLENRVDSYDSWRFAGDWNQVIIDDRLAIRFAAMSEDKRSFIEPLFDRDERFYVAVHAKLIETRNYRLSARYQFETVDQVNVTRPWALPNDNITAWQEAGSPTYDSPTEVPPAMRWPAGMRQMANAFTVTPVVSGSDGEVPVYIFGNRPTSMQSKTDGGIRYRIGSEFSKAMIPGTDKPLPIDVSYRANKFGYDLESKSHSVFLEEVFFNKIFTEFAWYRQETDRDWDRSNGGNELHVDVLEYLPSKDPDVKIPNPNVGKIFTQGHLRIQEQYREIEVFRFTAGFELDLSESASWLGRHRFGFLLENSRDLLGLNDYVDVNLLTDRGAFANNLPNFGNRVVRRSYLFGEDGDFWNPGGGPGLPGYTKISGIVDPNSAQAESGDPFETGLVNFRVSRGETEVDSWVISMQSFFPAPGFGNVSERLVPFWGIRGDDQVSTQLISADMNASKVRGVFPDWWTLPYDVASTFDDTTLTWGFVYRLTPSISFFYNSSEVLAPGSSRQNVFGEVIDPSTGDGWDTGIRFEFLDGKLVGSLSYFQATQFYIPRFNVFGGQTGEPFNNFIEALQNWDEAPSYDYEAAIIQVANPIDTYDNDARGLDLEITYNPTPRWRISLRGTKNHNQESNVLNASFEHWTTYMEPLEVALIDAGLYDSDIPDYNSTPAEFYLDSRREIANEKFAREGIRAIRSAKWRFTLVTNYKFDNNGPLKGFSVGGSVRYVSPKAVQALLDSPIGPFSGEYVFTDETYVVGLNVGYWRKLNNGVRMNIRLNVNNLFDDDDPEVQAANILTGEVYAIRPIEGRSVSLTTSFRF